MLLSILIHQPTCSGGRQNSDAYGASFMKNIKIEYFAVLREHAGTDAEQVSTAAATVGELFAELEARYAFPSLSSVKAAVNDEFSDWDAVINDGDSVVYIPPVAGG
jgi:molybdopterin converting factor subunit 1